MFKDYDKYLSTSLKVYIFVLLFVFILKLVGMDYFGLATDNSTIIKVNDICLMLKLDYIYALIICFISSYITMSLTLGENSKKLLIFMVVTFPITFAVKYSGYYINDILYLILQLIYLYLLVIIYDKRIRRETITNYIFYNFVFLIIQGISVFLRNLHFTATGYNFLISFIINLDYLMLIIILHKVVMLKGGKLCYHYQTVEVGLSLLKKINLKKSLKKLQVNLHKFRALPKQERLSISIYIVLSLLWNTLSLVIILLIANLNHTFIECLFILTSFWLSKHAFGKPFHLPSMIQCFIVSNLTYYILNKITTPLGISIFIPMKILLRY